MESDERFDDNKEASRDLVKAKDDILVYHTDKEKIEVEIKQIFGYRGVILWIYNFWHRKTHR